MKKIEKLIEIRKIRPIEATNEVTERFYLDNFRLVIDKINEIIERLNLYELIK